MEDYAEKSELGFRINLAFISTIGAMKDIDIESLTNDPVELMATFEKAINQWIIDNPIKAADIAEEVVAMVNEDRKIRGDRDIAKYKNTNFFTAQQYFPSFTIMYNLMVL